jgi:hypothetical protein
MSDTRTTPRYLFSAPAEIVVEQSGAKTLARVKELSLHGCYVEGAIPLGVKTEVIIKIFGPKDYFEATATVVHANPTIGIGLAYRNVKPHFRDVLQKWLLAAMQKTI